MGPDQSQVLVQRRNAQAVQSPPAPGKQKQESDDLYSRRDRTLEEWRFVAFGDGCAGKERRRPRALRRRRHPHRAPQGPASFPGIPGVFSLRINPAPRMNLLLLLLLLLLLIGQPVTPEMLEFMRQLRQHVTLGVVGGSDLVKITEQLGKSVFTDYDYVFSENGLVAHKNGELIGTQSLKSFLGEDKLKEIINFTLHYIADLDIPIKTGTFIEVRNGMINVSPIGRNCSQEERDEFEKYDKVHNIRPKMVSVLRERFTHLNLTFSIGGQISFDVFPQGWDKTYCLRYLEEFQEIHFFGDKTYKGGNDYEIFVSDRTVGHTVTSPDDTLQQCRDLFMSK